MANLDYLGKAEKYPFTNSNGSTILVDKLDVLKQSIFDIIETPIGTIFYNEQYGSYLKKLSFKQNDKVLVSLLIYFISEALFVYEKRISVIDIDCEISTSKIDCIIYYQILASNEINSFVYPFYKELKV